MNITDCLPQDVENALLLGRIWRGDVGPVPVLVRHGGVYDLSSVAPVMSWLLEIDELPVKLSGADDLPLLCELHELVLGGEVAVNNRLLAPCDLQAIKASGVTFVASLIERVIEEQAHGDASKAQAIRSHIQQLIGDDLSSIKPGSEEALKVKAVLLEQDAWSQYLEVGIGTDAEIFTKSQPMSAVGAGDEVGLNRHSCWNNPEPEVVLTVNSRGRIVGATLGNDVNLRDIEGRSALLLGKAKDNNASCAIGPFIRLFDDNFGLADIEACDVQLAIDGPEGYHLDATSSMSMISRSPADLVGQAYNASHQYPDGFMLFLGTMFAPTDDRNEPGMGFTHTVGDLVSISTPRLGCLRNRVNYSDVAAPWTFGTSALLRNLLSRQA
jgi:fumarylacetoacetate (FAA) hydrolase family protein